MTTGPLSLGLAVLAVVLLIAAAARNSRTAVERQLVSYWASDDGSTLYTIGGRGVHGSKVVYQLKADSDPIETPGYLSVGWGAAALTAFAGSDDVSFAAPAGGVDLGDGQSAAGGHLELAAGRLTLVDRSGTPLGSFFRAPLAAARANAALAGAGDTGSDDLISSV